MRNGLVLLAFAIVFSGCSGSGGEAPAGPAAFDADVSSNEGAMPSDENAPLPPPAQETGPSVRTFSQDFSLMITQAKASTNQVNLDNNCVAFGKGNVWMVFNGTAEATWSSSTPFGQQLKLEIWDGGGQSLLYASDPAASPARLDHGQYRITQASTLGLAYLVQPVENGAIVKMPVTLSITFQYVGLEDLGARVLPCHPTPTQYDEEGLP